MARPLANAAKRAGSLKLVPITVLPEGEAMPRASKDLREVGDVLRDVGGFRSRDEACDVVGDGGRFRRWSSAHVSLRFSLGSRLRGNDGGQRRGAQPGAPLVPTPLSWPPPCPRCRTRC